MGLEYLIQKCGENNIELSNIQINQFETYINLLLTWNEKMNLTAITDYNEIVEKHFVDSLMPYLRGYICGKVCDVGSGAGFPSIPMAIVDSRLDITIVEPLNKRCTFMREVISQLNLKNIVVENARSEDYVKVKRETFDIVIARAVANLSTLSELCIPLVKVGGQFVAMKADKGKEEYENGKNAISKLGGKLYRFDEYRLSGMTRINILINKVSATPSKYPRNYSQIKSKPL